VVRIVSLLPSATEILYALGAGDDVVGVSFECDFPPEARSRRIVSTSTLPAGLTPRQIDAEVRSRVAAGQDLYRLDEGTLRELDPDLILTQDLCAVCAVDVHTVDAALKHLGCQAQVVTVDPHTLQEVLVSIVTVGDRIGRAPAAQELVAALGSRLDRVAAAVADRDRPRVAMLEWTDPPFTAGHWVPEMVSAAGGTSTLGESGHRSEATTWDAVVRSRPDVVVCSPCGYGLAAAVELATQVRHAGHLPEGCRCGRWMPTPRSCDRVRGSSTASRPWRGSAIPAWCRRGRTSPYGSDWSGVAQVGRRSAKTNPSRSVISPTAT